MEQGASPNEFEANSRMGIPVLSLMAMRGDVPMVKKLLELGADPTKVDYSDHTALIFAAAGAHEGVVRVLLESLRSRAARSVPL